MPGIALVIEGAMQHAPQPDRHSICSAFYSGPGWLQAARSPEHLIHHGLRALLRRFFQQVVLLVEGAARTCQRIGLGCDPAVQVEEQGNEMALRAQATECTR
jgi:hypothetical protein